MQRILQTTLYFIEVRTDEGVLHKIGVTTRPIEQRLAEIRLDLVTHFGAVEVVPLGTWAHRGNVELYFKHRYRQFQRPIGSLTEYFAFDDVKCVLRDLRRMKPKELTDSEREVMAGKSSSVEQRVLQPEEMISPEAWHALCHLTNENLNRRYGIRYELRNFIWKGERRGLIESIPGINGDQSRRTAFGEVYYAMFAQHYKHVYVDFNVPA
jgi:hypothetical protein